MTNRSAGRQSPAAQAAIIVLIVLTGVMLSALFSRTMSHPPLDVPPFALGPFLGASLAIGAAALYLGRQAPRAGRALSILFALTALVSFGPQKYFDPAFLRIWPAVVAAQVAITMIVVDSILIMRARRSGS